MAKATKNSPPPTPPPPVTYTLEVDEVELQALVALLGACCISDTFDSWHIYSVFMVALGGLDRRTMKVLGDAGDSSLELVSAT